MKNQFSVAIILIGFAMTLTGCNNARISICPSNPHYFFYKNKPLVLITSDHHYGAIIDRDFDYVKFLDYLSENDMNLTRIYPGGMFESPDKYQKGNPLGPLPGKQILPWSKSDQEGANQLLAEAGKPSYKFDLKKWNPEYFKRLKAFVKYAESKNIIVEIPFFNGMYADCWPLNAMYAENNIQKVGQYAAIDCGLFTTADPRNNEVMHYQEAYIRKITTELNSFYNLIFDVCDEPSLQGLPDGNIKFLPDSLVIPWINRMKSAFIQAESSLPKKHLLGQTVQNLSPDLSGENWCKWLPTEYCKPASRALELDYRVNKPIVDVESNFFGISLTKNPYGAEAVRLEGWWFMLGGGAGCINLNGEYHRGQETGGSSTQNLIVPQKKILAKFMKGLNLAGLSEYYGIKGIPADLICKALAEEGEQYAAYIFHGSFEPEWGSHFIYNTGNHSDTLTFTNIPAATYRLEWIDPASGKVISNSLLQSNGGELRAITPNYSIDLALKMNRQ